MSVWIQKKIKLAPKARGFHIITGEIISNLPELEAIEIGLAHFFIQHTSASLSLNENADPSVREDFESHLNRVVPENASYFTHTLEGSDDMPAHLKASILGASVSMPIANGCLCMGTWQGIYLGEHRNRAGSRSLIATLNGDNY